MVYLRLLNELIKVLILGLLFIFNNRLFGGSNVIFLMG